MRTPLLLLFAILTIISKSQNWQFEEIGKLPFKTTNNAVTIGYHNGQAHIFSFGGIDSTLSYDGIHLRSSAVNITTQKIIILDDIPDTLGKIAAGASTIKNKIYVIGGYHVYENGNEQSSNKVHCFNPATLQWEEDKSPAPIPVDDHVQVAWNDSLIYVISGWSNTKNVPDVQIYNPSSDTWAAGTAVPNNNKYKAFGASGTIIGNTIYYLGGASMSANFPATFRLRVGEINPLSPSQINWRDSLLEPSDKFYRAGCSHISGYPIWFGGSSSSYNYDALSYAAGSIVSPSERSLLLFGNSSIKTTTPELPMDIRGVGELDKTTKILAGGIYADRKVSNKIIKLSWGYPISISEASEKKVLSVYPNPFNEVIKIETEDYVSATILNLLGQEIVRISKPIINTSTFLPGTYIIKIVKRQGVSFHRILKE